MDPLQAVRGMRDQFPETLLLWQDLEQCIERLFLRYGYQEVRLPLLERTELFSRGIGEATDIVEKEMYTFEDRSGERLSLRPEGTAGCVRAAIEHGLLHHQQHKWWYYGPMFRYERPQKGRYRQFYQYGVECFGFPGAEIELELLALSYRLWQELGLSEGIQLQINSLGSSDSRQNYRSSLLSYLENKKSLLDEDSLRRLSLNPLRILDSKNPAMFDLIKEAPKLLYYLDEESRLHFEKLQAGLDALGIPYILNPNLVRGLDYYSKTVFEWVSSELGAQSAVCAGGRYDGLVGLLGAKHPTPAIGLAFGVERIIALLEAKAQSSGEKNRTQAVDIYFVVGDEPGLQEQAFVLSENLRSAMPRLNVVQDLLGGAFKKQFKRADKANAHFALILGSEEANTQTISVKNLRVQGEQESLAQSDLVQYLDKRMEHNG
jgi:histidyl-tRNA synthetase